MSYLSYLIAFFSVLLSNTAGLTGNQKIDLFLQTAVSIEQWFLSVWTGIAYVATAIALAAIIVSILLSLGKKRGGLGCLPVPFVMVAVIPWVIVLLEKLTLWIATSLAGSFDPTLGVTDPFTFWGLVIFMVLIGAG